MAYATIASRIFVQAPCIAGQDGAQAEGLVHIEDVSL